MISTRSRVIMSRNSSWMCMRNIRDFAKRIKKSQSMIWLSKRSKQWLEEGQSLKIHLTFSFLWTAQVKISSLLLPSTNSRWVTRACNKAIKWEVTRSTKHSTHLSSRLQAWLLLQTWCSKIIKAPCPSFHRGTPWMNRVALLHLSHRQCKIYSSSNSSCNIKIQVLQAQVCQFKTDRKALISSPSHQTITEVFGRNRRLGSLLEV